MAEAQWFKVVQVIDVEHPRNAVKFVVDMAEKGQGSLVVDPAKIHAAEMEGDTGKAVRCFMEKGEYVFAFPNPGMAHRIFTHFRGSPVEMKMEDFDGKPAQARQFQIDHEGTLYVLMEDGQLYRRARTGGDWYRLELPEIER